MVGAMCDRAGTIRTGREPHAPGRKQQRSSRKDRTESRMPPLEQVPAETLVDERALREEGDMLEQKHWLSALA